MNDNLDIRLAGFNVDVDVLRSITRDASLPLTPETLSAAYARISRSADSIPELRMQARQEVSKARESNSRIIFDMGHHSIAEHAVFNFDIMGISRLAMEEIEGMRLVSFTEKSQRYVKLSGDTLLPGELSDKHLATAFRKSAKAQNNFYLDALTVIEKHLMAARISGAEKIPRQQLRNLAKEDARYALCLATRGQLGMTINARNLEHLMRRTSLSPLQEVREVGKRLYELVKHVAPSLILFPEASVFDRRMRAGTPVAAPERPLDASPEQQDVYTVIDAPQHGDEMLLTAMLARTQGLDWKTSRQGIAKLDSARKRTLFQDMFADMEFFDSVPREFELPVFVFDLVVSASCYAQLKRHRMATLLPGSYHPDLGITVPEVFAATGLEKGFLDLIDQTNELYQRMVPTLAEAAAYVLTNAHRRRVLVKMNLREVFHFIRLRADQHAQWDIRNLALWMQREVQRTMPLGSMLLCGKSEFTKMYEKVFNKKPQHRI